MNEQQPERRKPDIGTDMKKAFFLILMLTVIIITGCSKDLITMMSEDTRSDVFQETSGCAPIPSGYAKLTIASSLKTHKPGIYPYGSKIKGTPDYVLLVNMDGQKMIVKGDLREEKHEQEGLADPETGEGIRYSFKKAVLLKAGPHKLFVALPEERAVVELELTLKEGTTNTLRLEPMYRSAGNHGSGVKSSSSFMAGIVGFWAYLNGSRV